ncbi:hypothetical protein Csa_018780 [Cucumis sativus]|uniref:Uncharacterized protein n=1 Tax=Cucumis sativus TaxID=3659 RepID=A0A0A0LN75_CUCSA|nr:hypothetical protein Csa_018780 [Cucumis sativus]
MRHVINEKLELNGQKLRGTGNIKSSPALRKRIKNDIEPVKRLSFITTLLDPVRLLHQNQYSYNEPTPPLSTNSQGPKEREIAICNMDLSDYSHRCFCDLMF